MKINITNKTNSNRSAFSVRFGRAAAALLSAAMLFTLAACGKPAESAPSPLPSPTQQVTPPAEQPQAQPEGTEAPAVESAAPVAAPASDAEPWKAEFEKSLLENYGVTPEYYEDLGNGIYQVYVNIDGKLVPYVAVDSATGDYHG